MAGGSKRLAKELADLRQKPVAAIAHIDVDEGNILLWKLLVVPDCEPYNKAAFRAELTFPPEFPFKPPRLAFLTKIYHPNVDENGRVCLPLLLADNWKPATKTAQILESLVQLVANPDPDHPMRADVATQYTDDRASFMKTAEQLASTHAEPRPAA